MSAPTSTQTPPEPAPASSDLIGSGQEGGLGDQMQAWWQRVRGGEMGALPAVGGLVVLCLLFGLLSGFFFTERNFANLFNQAAGVTGGNAMAIFVVLNANGVPWQLALLVGFLFGIAVGAVIGFFVARVGIPSFVVTLGLFLGLQGLALLIIGEGGLYRLDVPELRALQNGSLPVWGGWVMLAVILAISAGTSFWDRS